MYTSRFGCQKYQEMKRFEVKAKDLIMSCSGTYGKIAVVPEGSPKGIINQALLKITPTKGVRSQFIKHWMQSSLFQVELEKGIGGAALQNVPSVAKMKSIEIRLPEEKIAPGKQKLYVHPRPAANVEQTW
jgi:type I restriction enzyme S subunit